MYGPAAAAVESLLDVGSGVSLGSCVLMAVVFVGSLYVWDASDRDAPATIVRRCSSVCVASVLSSAWVWLWLAPDAPSGSLLTVLGLRAQACVWGALLPLALTMTLFAGPLLMLYYDEGSTWTPPLLRRRLAFAVQNLQWWRNIVVGPLAEEWVFRACMYPMLVASGWSMGGCLLVPPILFGASHVHHLLSHLHKQGMQWKHALLATVFQLFYTTVFGSFAGFLFLRTGHLSGAFLSHAFCNYMGFPDFGGIQGHRHQKALTVTLIGGIILFFVAMLPLTSPSFYGSPFVRIQS